VASTLLTVISSVLSGIIPFFAKVQLDQLSQPNTSLYSLPTTPYILFLAFLLIPAALTIGQEFLSELVHNRILNTMSRSFEIETRRRIWEKLYDFDAGYLESERNSFLFNQASQTTRLPSEILSFFRSNLSIVVTLITIIPLLFLVSPWLLILIFCGAALQFFFSQKQFQERMVDNLEYEHLSRQRDKYDRVLYYFFQHIKQMGIVRQIIQDQLKIYDQEQRISQRRGIEREQFRLLQFGIDNLIAVAINLFVGYQVLSGSLELGTFVLTVSYTQQISYMMKRITYIVDDWHKIDFDYFRLSFFLQLNSRWKKPESPQQLKQVEAIKLHHVSFSYPDYYEEERQYLRQLKEKITSYLQVGGTGSWYYRDSLTELEQLLAQPSRNETVLHQVSLELKRGQVTALLGRNGAGKTTITRLLMHHFEPTSGHVLVNKTSIDQLDQEWLFRQFAILTQTPLVLPRFSVRENLTFGVDRKVTDEEIWYILQQVGLELALRKVTKGLEANIGEDTRLSGGQEQLLVLARVLLQQRPFIILDEGTSQLDVENEARILKLLMTQAHEKNAGVLFITHRVTTARKADTLLIIDNGKIVEQGTHHELLEKEGLYSTFWQTQIVA
jgi:ABC-type multidrug transport system fused ATPase/permease subunit